MIQNNSVDNEGTTPQQLWQQQPSPTVGIQDQEISPVPDQPADPTQFTFVMGQAETITFAWPNNALPALSNLMIHAPHNLPPIWKENWLGPTFATQTELQTP